MAFTFFFRDSQTIEHAAEHMIRYASGRSRIKVWDAGCALGQETYTIAMVFAERMNHFGFKNLRIHATDYDRANNFGEAVTSAAYPAEQLRRTPPAMFDKYFEPDEKPGHFRIIQELRSRVSFQYHDLLSLEPAGSDYCLIVCKNVMLHFQYPERVEVFRMFHRALAPGGYLAVENTQPLPVEVTNLYNQVTPATRIFKKVGD